AASQRTLLETGALTHRYRFRAKSGEWVWVRDDLHVVERPGESVRTLIGAWVDVTELERREAQLALALEVSEVGLYELDLDTLEVSTNARYARMLGHEPEGFRLTNEAWRSCLHPDDRARAMAVFDDYVAGRIPSYRNEFRLRTASGEHVWVLSVGRIIERHPDGRPRRMIGTHTDITAVKASIDQARMREELLDQLGVGVIMCDGEGRLSVFNRVAAEWHDVPAEPSVALAQWADRYKLFEWDGLTRLSPERVPLARAFAGEVVRDAPMAIQNGERLRFIRANAAPLVDPDGRRIGALAVLHDVSALVDSEVMLRLQRAALEAAANAIVITDREGLILWANKAFTALTGYNLEEARGKNPGALVRSERTPREVYTSMWDTILAGRVWSGEIINRKKDGTLYPEALTISPVLGPSGQPTHFIAIKRDLTEERELAVRMHQAEKMESIGRLAGGVAHDFNNLLTVINGGLDLALEELGAQDTKLRRELEEVRQASERATTLTGQLLAFGRQQVLRNERIRLRIVVGELLRMLERLLGERVTIAAELGGAGRVIADKGQLEQVIVNLVVNARDAMPDGGTLTIKTEDRVVRPLDVAGLIDDLRIAEPSRARPCAILSISDTGHGIAPAVLEHLFEPFFTTK
ncbi:MAG TPA: PAS domain S-box protein, partial [Myxococcota bacterium]|nr:PAS domain S-box protein [Myxococcota bacterium]